MWLTVSMSKLRPPSDVVRCVPGLVTWHTAATQHSSAQTFTTRRGSCEPGPAWRLGNQVERGTARSRAREMAVADSGATENLLYPLYSYFNFTLHYLNFPLLLLHAWNRPSSPLICGCIKSRPWTCARTGGGSGSVQAKQGQLGPIIQTNEELTSGKRENVDIGAISSNLMIHM